MKYITIITARILFCLLCVVSLNSNAIKVFRIDDSASQPVDAQGQLNWKSLLPVGADAHTVEANTRVNIKLDVKPWLGQRGRIYLVLPVLSQGVAETLSVDWVTQGRLQPGRLGANRRGLVYQGSINTQILEDVMTLKVAGDGRRITSPQRLQFYFEIEPE
jgi:hypothetical protein